MANKKMLCENARFVRIFLVARFSAFYIFVSFAVSDFAISSLTQEEATKAASRVS